MMRAASLVLAVALALGACGGGPPAEPTLPVDENLQRDTRAGRIAYLQERPEEAIAQYRLALARAQARDDLDAIGDLGYNLAVAELRANAPDRALAVAQATRAELERRANGAFPALLLAEATALYRTEARDAADALARRVQSMADREAAARAGFLRGLIADERGDEATLAASAAGLRQATDPALRADAAELDARLALRRGEPALAESRAAQAVTLRQDALDYRGVARALALQADAVRTLGRGPAAADLYLRAGRSAAAQGDPANARPWLAQARRLATDKAVTDAIDALLDKL